MRAILFIITCLFLAQPLVAQNVYLREETNNQDYRLWMTNDLPCPFYLSGRSELMDVSFEQFMPANTEQFLLQIPADSIQKYPNFKNYLLYNITMGDPNAIPDTTYQYVLPYPQGDSYKLAQGNNGNFTHNMPGTIYAFDFEMPEGSTVTAARGGVVIYVTDWFKKGGIDDSYKDRGNQVLVCHDDGTIAFYGHLMYKGALVRIGERVFPGQPIGLSGNTGYSNIPHLHFVVVVARQSIFIRFKNLPAKLTEDKFYSQEFNY